MPSGSLSKWSGTRLAALNEIDVQCAACAALPISNPALLDENLRAYVLVLSAHFQGFCRDLHTECAQFVGNNVPAAIRFLVLQSFTTPKTALDHGNPNLENLKADFSRFGFVLDLPNSDPANPTRLNDLADLNKWRNAAAHHADPPTKGKPPQVIPLNLPSIRVWKISCSGLAASLDGIMYNQLTSLIIGPKPWIP